MRHTNFLFFSGLLTLVFLTSCGKKLWVLYKPAQANIVGKSIKNYDSKSYQIGLGVIHTNSGTIETEDTPSSTSETQILNKQLTLDIKGFLGEKKLLTEVATTKATVTNLKSIKDFKYGRFVYAGIKAEKAIVKISKKSSTQINPAELLKGVENFVKNINPVIIEVAGLVKDISIDSENEYKYEITNPDVYFMIQEAEVVGSFSENWFQDFASPSFEGPNFVLSPANDITRSIIRPFISKGFRNKVSPIQVQLAYRLENNQPALYVRYSTATGTEMKLIPMFSSTRWNDANFIVKEYDLDANHYKVVKIEIDARLDGDKIIVTTAKVKYPEKEVRINKR